MSDRRLRFAPSPSGFLHVGGVRTALYNWLLARKWDAAFVVRIEDTDAERSSQESVDLILDTLAWFGLDWDEGPRVGGEHGPYRQSERSRLYGEYLERLLAAGAAYPCTCSREALDAAREAARADKRTFRYGGTCRHKTLADVGDEAYVIRVRSIDSGEVSWTDAVVGHRTFAAEDLDDFVIARADGSPLYNFAVVVDDLSMGITDVVRGADHINNTAKQLVLYRAFAATPPRFAHVPLIHNSAGGKMSKRDQGADALDYRQQGVPPAAGLNFLARIGWSHGDDEVFTVPELIEKFSFEGIGKSPGVLNPEKLLWVSSQHIQAMSVPELAAQARPFFDELEADVSDEASYAVVVQAMQPRAKTLRELAQSSLYFFVPGAVDIDPAAAKKNLKVSTEPVLVALRDALAEQRDWSAEALHGVVNDLAQSMDLKLGKVAQPLRVALAGGPVSPPIDVTLAAIGQERSLARIDRALEYIRARAAAAQAG
jgi:glutamyl-tRNA synthetase